MSCGLRPYRLYTTVVAAAVIGELVAGCTIADLALGCRPVTPRQLPSGAPPGDPIEDVAAGAKQVVWGSDSDRVEQLIDLSLPGTRIADVTVRDQPASLYRVTSDDEWDLAFSWHQDGCDYTVFLAPGTSPDQAVDYAARF